VICYLLATMLTACAPRPTETPSLAPATSTPPPATVPRLVNPVVRETNTAVPTQTPLEEVASETAVPTPLPTARAHKYDDVDELGILSAVFQGLTLTPDSQGYEVQGSPDWVVWTNDRDEGRITQAQRDELVAIVANQVGANAPKEEASFGPSSDWIVILENRDGKLVVTQREAISPPLSPLTSDVRIERTVDVAHTGQDDLLITTNAVQSLVIRTEVHLYGWQAGKFVELWQGLEQDDNTAAVNQTEYYSYQATVDFADLDNSGVDEIIDDGTRTTYPKDNDGRADLTSPASVTEERDVYKWDGSAFALDATLSTPPAPTGTATP
jgi:hypothetical protein